MVHHSRSSPNFDQRAGRIGVQRLAPLLVATLALGCGSGPPTPEAAPPPSSQTSFWSALHSLCGQAFEGRLVRGSESDSTFRENQIVMHVRECSDREVRIPLHLGDDRSRNWVLSQGEDGLRLTHDHRNVDGSPDEITGYGGRAAGDGTAEWQEFPADSYTAGLVPAASTNIWTIEVIPDTIFAYALRREGTGRHFRLEFDLSRPVPAPPAPWGWTDRVLED